jgi:hypothetical protein
VQLVRLNTEKACLLAQEFQAHRLSSVLAVYEGVPRAMDRQTPALFTRGEISHMRIWSAG